MSSVIGNCPLCEEHSLHIIGKDNLKTQQCINCGYVTAEKFKLDEIIENHMKDVPQQVGLNLPK